MINKDIFFEFDEIYFTSPQKQIHPNSSISQIHKTIFVIKDEDFSQKDASPTKYTTRILAI
jgi:hypothetical protein